MGTFEAAWQHHPKNTLLYKVLAVKYLWGLARRVPIPARAAINTELGCGCIAQAAMQKVGGSLYPVSWWGCWNGTSLCGWNRHLHRGMPQRYWLQSHSGEGWGWRDVLCSQVRAKAGSHHHNLLNINKIQKYRHKMNKTEMKGRAIDGGCLQGKWKIRCSSFLLRNPLLRLHGSSASGEDLLRPVKVIENSQCSSAGRHYLPESSRVWDGICVSVLLSTLIMDAIAAAPPGQSRAV